MKVLAFLAIAICSVILFGCGKGSSDALCQPPVGDSIGVTAHEPDANGAKRIFVGYWDMVYNWTTGEFEAVPIRDAMFHLNVVQFLNGSAANVYPKVYSSSIQTGEFHIDITLKHPIVDATHDYTGHDVRGIVIGNLSSKDDPDILSAKDDPDLMWFGPHGMRLANPDGWTRWWNQNEFTDPGIFGFLYGLLGSANFKPDKLPTLNPYKYFDKTLDSAEGPMRGQGNTERGLFEEGKEITRRYELLFPIQQGGGCDPRFQYVVDACWDENQSLAISPEAWFVGVDAENSTAYYDTANESKGGDLTLNIEVFDEGAKDNPEGILGEVSKLIVQSGTLFTGYVTWNKDTDDFVSTSDTSGIFTVIVHNVTPSALTYQEVLVTVYAAGSKTDYNSGAGTAYPVGEKLAAYALVTVPIRALNLTNDGHYGTAGEFVDVAAKDYVCYVADTIDGLAIVNMSNTKVPKLLKAVGLTSVPVAIDYFEIAGSGYVAVAGQSNSLTIVDVVPAANAYAFLPSVSLPGTPSSVDVFGGYAYVGCGTQMAVVDIDPPESAYYLTSAPISVAGTIVDIKAGSQGVNKYAYVLANSLEIFDISTPALPPQSEKTVTIPQPGTALDVSSTGFAFVGDGASHLYAVDVSPPGTASIKKTVTVGGAVNDLQACGSMAYLAVNLKGLEVWCYDVNANTLALMKDYASTSYDNVCVVEELGLIYLDGGLDIFNFGPREEEPSQGWANTWGGVGEDLPNGVAIDELGNRFVVGYFDGANVDFDPGVGEELIDSHGSYDAFLVKFGADSTFEWVRTWGGSEIDVPDEVDIDSVGNVYLSGRFNSQNVDFDPGPGTDIHSSNGKYDCFIAKYTTEGDMLWTRSWGGSGEDWGSSKPTVDLEGNVYMCGEFTGTVDFDPDPAQSFFLTSHNDTSDAFLTKFDPTGDFLWAAEWGSNENYDAAAWVDVDPLGYVYVTGFFTGTVDFDPGPGVVEHTVVGVRDCFLSKFSTDGTFQWVDTWGGAEGTDFSWEVEYVPSGDLYLTGQFRGDVDFDPGPGVAMGAKFGGPDAYLLKLSSDGAFKWVRTWGGSNQDDGAELAVDKDGYIYVAGYFGSPDTIFGPGKPPVEARGKFDCSVSKFNTSGTLQWFLTFGGPGTNPSGDACIGIDMDTSGVPYVCGFFAGTVDFAPGPETEEHTAKGSGPTDQSLDAFLLKLLPNGEW